MVQAYLEHHCNLSNIDNGNMILEEALDFQAFTLCTFSA